MKDPAPLSKAKPAPLILRPSRRTRLNLGDLWQYRELVYFLTWRDLLVRYKQTVLGAAWAIINPVINMIVLEFIFGRLAGITSGEIPGPVFRYAAVLPWMLFSRALSSTGNAMLANRAMITKVYFPRLIIPLSTVLSGLVDFAISFVVFVLMMVYYSILPPTMVWLLPAFILLTLIAALGVGLWLAALNVLYRDIGYVLPVLTQLLFFISPLGFSITSVPANLQWVYALNPMVGVIEGFRWTLLGIEPIAALSLLQIIGISSASAFVFLITGLYYFRRMERTFADTI
jgi:lipopolysaccharide transport system permease protein